MKSYFYKFLYVLFVSVLLFPTEVNAKTPIEYYKNPHGIAFEQTTDHFVIENYNNNFAIGNLMIMIASEDVDDFPILGFIFDDISSQNRSANLLKKEKIPVKYVFEDGTSLNATGYIKKGYGGFSPVCISCCISNLRTSSENPEISNSRNSRNIGILSSKKITQVQAGEYVLNVRSTVKEDPLFNSTEIINDMLADLRRRYSNHKNLK